MAGSEYAVRAGMDVYDADERYVGMVTRVYPVPERFARGDAGLGCFKVRRGPLPILGPKPLLVPFDRQADDIQQGAGYLGEEPGLGRRDRWEAEHRPGGPLAADAVQPHPAEGRAAQGPAADEPLLDQLRQEISGEKNDERAQHGWDYVGQLRERFLQALEEGQGRVFLEGLHA